MGDIKYTGLNNVQGIKKFYIPLINTCHPNLVICIIKEYFRELKRVRAA